ncbi:NGG1p interacting factor NIF3 [Aliamphritea spongicola]|nr:NGG1p interacting factor NIF3 [Aliamphritea spongicola]
MFFVPEDSLETVKEALFTAGAGRIGDYDNCCWQVLGQGQFRPLEGSNPHIGSVHKVERLAEWKVELVCEDSLISSVVEELKRSHPYEEVAYEVYKLADF